MHIHVRFLKMFTICNVHKLKYIQSILNNYYIMPLRVISYHLKKFILCSIVNAYHYQNECLPLKKFSRK